jgi:uracil-DNA glycosylase
MSSTPSHYWHGTLQTAFVFSVPGATEKSQGRPISGATGANLDKALILLSKANASVFPSIQRYDYRITNAFDHPRATSLGDKSSEASASEIRMPKNIARVLQEIADCNVVILCGRKAQLLSAEIRTAHRHITVADAAHLGNSGLNRAYPNGEIAKSNGAGQAHRIELWVRDLLAKIRREK